MLRDEEEILYKIRETYFREYVKIRDKEKEFDSIFSRHVPIWDGGYDNLGRTQSNKWKKIWDFLEANDCPDFQGFITANFKKFGVVYPNQLYNKRALEAYKEFIKERQKQVLKLYFELQIFLKQKEFWQRQGKDEITAIKLSLYDSSNSFSPLFCFLVATSINDEEGKKKYKEGAYRQFISARNDYIKVWPSIVELLPEVAYNCSSEG